MTFHLSFNIIFPYIFRFGIYIVYVSSNFLSFLKVDLALCGSSLLLVLLLALLRFALSSCPIMPLQSMLKHSSPEILNPSVVVSYTLAL